MKSADRVVGLPGKNPFDLLEAAAEKYLFASCVYYLLATRAAQPEDLTTESLRKIREGGPLVCTVTVKVSERMKEDFESAAEKAGASVPDALREAISSYIATHA